MRVLVLIAMCLLAAPLWAELAEPAEAHATLSALKDRLRVMYRDNGNKIDTGWKIPDVLPATDLDGTYFTSADYSLQFDQARPSWVRLQCKGGGPYKGPLAVEVDLATGASEWRWPGPSAEEARAENVLAIKVAVALLAGPVLLVPVLFRKRLRPDLRTAIWLIGAGASSLAVQGFAAVFLHMFVTEHTPAQVASVASVGLLLGVCMVAVGFGMFLIAMMFPADLVRST